MALGSCLSFMVEEGMLFEGLVWTGDHWAWFPRALRVARMPLGSEE